MLSLNTLFSVQIITESLPISSSGHLALLHKLGIATVLSPLYTFYAHIPTVLIIFIFFAHHWYKKITSSPYTATFFFIGCADIFPVIAYLLKIPSLFSHLPLYYGFFLTSCLLFISCLPANTQSIPSWRDGIYIGLAQTAALCIPGLSRLATTYTTARLLKFSGKDAFSYAWLVQFPLLIAATAQCFFSLHNEHSYLITTLSMSTLTQATISAFIMLMFCATLAANNYIWLFGIYMLVPLCISVI